MIDDDSDLVIAMLIMVVMMKMMIKMIMSLPRR